MDLVGNILEKKNIVINDNNVNKNIFNNDINVNKDNSVNNIKNYSLNRDKFVPTTDETRLAEKIATEFGDLDNYAAILHIVNKIGIDKASELFQDVREIIKKKSYKRDYVRNKAAYFTAMYKAIYLRNDNS